VVNIVCSSKWNSTLWILLFIRVLIRFLVKSLFSFYIVFELSLIPILLIIIYWGNQPERISAGLYFLIYTSIMSVPYVLMLLLVIPNDKFFIIKRIFLRKIMTWMFLLPFLVKMPILGLHFWLPKAHVEARTRGSIVLAGILLKLGRYGVFRVLCLLRICFSTFYSAVWLVSSIFSRFITLIQSDVKKLIAYRRVTHMTLLIIPLISYNKGLFFRVLLVSLSHGWASIGIFARAGVFRHRANSRLSIIIGRERKLHWSRLVLGLLLVSNTSLPPFPSFFPEVWTILILNRTFKFIFILILLRVRVSYYNTYLFFLVSHYKQVEGIPNKLSLRGCFILYSFSWLLIVSIIWINLF